MSDSRRPLAFEPLADDPGLEVVDRIEQERCVCRTEAAVSPSPADADPFRFPVDRAVRIEAAELSLPNVAGVLVRDEAGEIVAQVQQLEAESLPAGRYNVELLTQFKAYLAVDSPVDVVADATEFRVDFGDATEIVLGARSNHERPAARVRTTEDPVDMMATVETFSSALKTPTADRAFPSLRGHPPAVELGDRLDVPESIDRPDTGVRLELPARRETVYVAAPLAYYLGAGVEPGPTPRLVTDDGFEYTLDGPHGYERTVERTLKQLFFLDCITRTEGLYRIDLYERDAVERLVDLDFEALYEMPLQEQIAAYLEVPYEVVEEHVPDWRLTTHVDPGPGTIEQLPFVVDDLAVVRTRAGAGAHTQASSPVPAGADLDDAFTRSASGQSSSASLDYVEPRSSDSLEQAWIGDEIPVGASKLTREAFENRLDRAPVDGDISISIVLNDPRMDQERDLADRAYGNRDSLPFEVDVDRDVTTDELRDLLRQETAFLHYIGHTERDGFECPDGKLDVRELDELGVQSFLLNACNSYEQGLGLIDGGAVGGIVTLNDVINDGAIKIGQTVARLLNSGFPLRVGLGIARDESILGGQYIVVGDGGMTVAQPECTTPNLLDVTTKGDEYQVDFETFPTDVAGLGSVFTPNVDESMKYYITSGKIDTYTMSKNELLRFAWMEQGPIRIDGDLHWRDSTNLGEVL
jgi:hypothetical protein